MASTADYFRVRAEETSRYFGAPTTAPYRRSTVTHDFPGTSAALAPDLDHLNLTDEFGLGEAVPEGIIEAIRAAGSLNFRLRAKDMIFGLYMNGWVGTHQAGSGTAVTDPDGETVPAGVSLWTFEKLSATDASNTVEAEIGYLNADQHYKAQGVTCTELTLNENGDVTLDLPGLTWARLADPSYTPSYGSPKPQPMIRKNILVTWLSGNGTPTGIEINSSNPSEPIQGLGIQGPYANEMLRADERMQVSGTVTMARLMDADVDAAAVGDTFAALCRWQQTDDEIGVTDYYPSVWLEMPNCQITSMDPDPLTTARRHGASYGWLATDDGTGTDATWYVALPTFAAYQTFA